MNDLKMYLDKIHQSKGIFSSLAKRKEECVRSLCKINTRIIHLEEAQAFLQEIARSTQEQLKFVIADTVNLCMDTCFPNEFDFDVMFEIKRGRTEAQLIFKKNGIDVDPMEASGGGVVDLASFALRISAWSLGHSDNVLIFDEPFRFLSKDLQPRAGEIMRKLAKHLKLQMILVSHNEAIIDSADRIFEVSQKSGVSEVVMKEGAHDDY